MRFQPQPTPMQQSVQGIAAAHTILEKQEQTSATILSGIRFLILDLVFFKTSCFQQMSWMFHQVTIPSITSSNQPLTMAVSAPLPPWAVGKALFLAQKGLPAHRECFRSSSGFCSLKKTIRFHFELPQWKVFDAGVFPILVTPLDVHLPCIVQSGGNRSARETFQLCQQHNCWCHKVFPNP